MRLIRLIIFLLILTAFPSVKASYVPYPEEWGIYSFSPESGETQLIHSNPHEITSIQVSPNGDRIVFSANLGDGYDYSEIFSINVDGSSLTQLTDNDHWDVYPQWSPNGMDIAFLSWRDESLDIYTMDSTGNDQQLLYDSGGHDADISWVGEHIAFTRDSQIWVMNSDGTEPMQLTDPPRAGEWGNAVLPFGDYDPRISPDGSTVVYERMVDDTSPHGNYDLFLVDIDGSNERRLTETGWTQGIASWSPSGGDLIFLVSAKGLEGAYDIYTIRPDGAGMSDLTGDIFPSVFLAHSPVYGPDGGVYFVGQWYGWERKASTISCTASKNEVSFGETVTISGEVQPEVHDIGLVLRIQKPDGGEEVASINSTDGSYSYTINCTDVGEWTVQVDWGGDKGYSASSNSVSFDVSEAAEESGGIPGFPLFSLLLGLIAISYIKKITLSRESSIL